MESGFILNDPKDFASSIYKSVQKSLDINPDATVEEEDDAEEPEVEENEANTKSDNIDEEQAIKDEL